MTPTNASELTLEQYELFEYQLIAPCLSVAQPYWLTTAPIASIYLNVSATNCLWDLAQ